MPAYVVIETDVTDPERYEQYKAAGSLSVAAAGGRYLVRGGELVVLEGDWQPSRLVVLEFEDLAAVRRGMSPRPTRRRGSCAKVQRACAQWPFRASTRQAWRELPRPHNPQQTSCARVRIGVYRAACGSLQFDSSRDYVRELKSAACC
jgi:uncharacterized protein (DUF1330 family)